MVSIPHGGEIVPGVTNYNGGYMVDLSAFAKRRDARLPENVAEHRQLNRGIRAADRRLGLTATREAEFIGDSTEHMVGSIELTPEQAEELNASYAEAIPRSLARLNARIAEREAQGPETVE